MCIDVKALQKEKAEFPIDVILLGMCIDVKAMQQKKASSHTTFVPFLIAYSSISLGAHNSLFLSALYFTLYSSIHAFSKSSSVTFVERISTSY